MKAFQKIVIPGVIFLFSIGIYAQHELNPYKYIIVPKKYEFLNKENQYRVNSYTRFLFEKEGYNTLYQGENYPDDLLENPCLGLKAMVSDNSSAFTTKIYIFLQNCNDQIVYQTEQGRSKVKDLNKTYVDALNKSFVSIQALNYSFDPSLVINSPSDSAPAQMTQQDPAVAKATTETVSQATEPKAAIAVIPAAVSEKAPVESAPVSEKETEVDTEVEAAQEAVQEAEEEMAEASEEEAVVVVGAESEKEAAPAVARAFGNETISFLLVNQGAQLQAFVSSSQIDAYKVGELIGTFKKTSLPNVFRVSWKIPQEGMEETTAYFDEAGDLNIDILIEGQIQVIKFKEIK